MLAKRNWELHLGDQKPIVATKDDLLTSISENTRTVTARLTLPKPGATSKASNRHSLSGKTIMEPLSNEEAREYMQSFLVYHSNSIAESNFDRIFYKSVTAQSAVVQDREQGTSAKAVFSFKIPPTYTNQPEGSSRLSTHGGAIATFFDMTTSLCIIACNFPGWESTGQSRRLDVTYLKPPIEGDECLIECEVIQIGKRLAVIRGVMKRESDNALLATCQHDKYMADLPHYVSEKGKL